MSLEIQSDGIASIVDRKEMESGLRDDPTFALQGQSTFRIADSVRIESIPVVHHDTQLRHEWDAIRSTNPALRSPFFSHQFIEAVDEIHGGMETAVAYVGNSLAGILPFHRRKKNCAVPIGAGINDAHALMVKPGVHIDCVALLDRLKLTSFAFHASPPDAPGVREFEVGRTKSFLADLTVDELGYEHFLCATSDSIDRQRQKTRRLQRQQGAIRLEYDCRDSGLIDYLIELKGEQYRRTHTFNILGVDWIGKLLHRLHEERDGKIRGLLSVLFAGDKPVALHYGLLEGSLLHYWFPVFEPAFAYASPGTILFLEIAREAAARGVAQIDMGYGEQKYKHKLTNVVSEMSYGIVDRNPFRRGLYRSRMAMRQGLKSLWFKEQVKSVVRRVLPNLGADRY